MSNNNNDEDDGFVDGMIATVLLGCAVYGAYKIVQNVTKSPEQRLLENLGRDLKAIDAGYTQDMRQIPYDGDDDED